MALNYTWISLDTWDLSTMAFTLAWNWDLNKGCTEGRCLKFQDFMSSKGHWISEIPKKNYSPNSLTPETERLHTNLDPDY